MREIRKVCHFALVVALLAVTLASCGLLPGFGGDTSANAPAQQGDPVRVDTSAQSPQLGVPEDQLSFGLSHPTAPDFQDDIPGSDMGVGDSSSTAQPVGDMYTEIDGYAYRLDPATMTPVGDPLDVITHEPVVLADTSEAGDGEGDAPTQELSPSQEVPTEETKYPNTGIFLEDD